MSDRRIQPLFRFNAPIRGGAGPVAAALGPMLLRALMGAVLGVLLGVPGCGILSAGGSARLTSMENGSVLAANLPTRVYSYTDKDTADLYMTDLPQSVWTTGPDVSSMAGVMVHVHMFLRPQAGHTPIADTASTAVIRVLVLAKGELGEYGGGGFFVNDGNPGGKTFSGSVRNGSMRLISKTKDFTDRLGPCTFAGEVSGKLDKDTAAAMERAMRALVAECSAVAGEQPKS